MEAKVLAVDESDQVAALVLKSEMEEIRDRAAQAKTPEEIRAALAALEAKAAEADRLANSLEERRREMAAQPPAFFGNRRERRRAEALWRQKKRRGA